MNNLGAYFEKHVPLFVVVSFFSPSNAPSYAPSKRSVPTLCTHSSLNKKGWFILFWGKQIRHFNKTLLWNSNKGEMRRKQRKIIHFLPDPIKGGILVLAHWSVSDDPSLQHLFPITPLFHYHISHRLNGVWAKIWIQRGNRRLISPSCLRFAPPFLLKKQRGLMTVRDN